MLVYGDTTAWNHLLETFGVRPPQWVCRPEYLVSTCNLDEFALAGAKKGQDLSRLAWKLSHRDVLRDHIAMTIEEVRAHHDGDTPRLHDPSPIHRIAWSKLRSRGISPREEIALQKVMDDAKRGQRDHDRGMRKFFSPLFAEADRAGMLTPWPQMLSELHSEGHFDRFLREICELAETSEPIVRPDATLRVTCSTTPCTACYMEYLAALRYIAATEKSRKSRPDYGDQVDFRHAAYAAICDVFVTSDDKLHRLLSEFVRAKRAEIIRPTEFLTRIAS